MCTDAKFDTNLKKLAKIIVVTAVVVMIGLFIYFVAIHATEKDSWITEIAKTHFAATIGLPFAALLAFFVVIILEHTFGPIEFEGLTFKFKGASGPIVLWVLTFFSIAFAIKILW